MNALLISTYDLGRQPFGLASPAAWLRRAGVAVTCLDLSREPLREGAVRSAEFIALHVPMHTATRIAGEILPAVRKLNPHAHICFYGLYAPVNEGYLRKLGAETILGGEFEAGLVSAVEGIRRGEAAKGADPGRAQVGRRHEPAGVRQREAVISFARQQFLTPDRGGLPPLSRYARLLMPSGENRLVGYTEASRGCKHLCRHCPIVPVYHGLFRVVQHGVVLEDIRQQVAAGARHVTFGDPDFFNGPRHAIELVKALHKEHPALTYDVTIKIEHLLQHARHLPTLRDTGCLFVTSAAESLDDAILKRLDKGHTYADFARVVELFREAGLTLAPTFVPFTPWSTLEGYAAFLRRLVDLGLIENVAPIQFAIRLLIPTGSRLLELSDVREMVGSFDESALVYPWEHDDPRVDMLGEKIQRMVQQAEQKGDSRRAVFSRVWWLAQEAVGGGGLPDVRDRRARSAIPYLSEPWYC